MKSFCSATEEKAFQNYETQLKTWLPHGFYGQTKNTHGSIRWFHQVVYHSFS